MFLQSDIFYNEIGNGLILLILGMGIVFIFLTILVFSTKGISKIVIGLEKRKPSRQEVVSDLNSVDVSTSSDESEVAAAITAVFVKSRS